MKKLHILGLFLFLSSISYGADFRWTQFRELLSTHEMWTSVVYEESLFGGDVSQQGKRWRVIHKTSGLQLFEVVPLTTSLKKGLTCENLKGLNESQKKASGFFEMSSSVIDLNGLIVFNPFVSDHLPCNSQDWEITEISQWDRFGLKISLNLNVFRKREIFIFPYVDTKLPPAQFSNAMGIFSTPLGIKDQHFDDYKISTASYERSFVRHDISRPRQVIINSEFPEKFFPLLKSIILGWNNLLGTDYFVFSKNREDFRAEHCLSGNVLCIFWPQGLTEIPWTGVGGVTHFSFDPISGGIIGGLIKIESEAKNLVSTPERHLKELQNPTFETLAEHTMKTNEYPIYFSPAPENDVKFVLNHEIGHFMGLKHNFFGFNGNSNEPYVSVMDYPPFILTYDPRLGDLHRWDKDLVKFIYHGTPISSDYRACGEASAIHAFGGANAVPDPNCNQFDMGSSPILWFQTLLSFAKDGVMASPGTSVPLAYSFGRFLLPKVQVDENHARIARTAICSDKNKSKALEYLKKTFSFELECR